MYLRTPKRYTRRGSKPRLISLRWLWLYLLAPVVIVVSALAWDFRDSLSQQINNAIAHIKLPQLNAPTVTPTLPAADLEARILSALQNGDLKAALDNMNAYSDSNPNDVKWHTILTQMLTMRAYGNEPQTGPQAAVDSGLTAINANPEVADGWAAEALALDWNTQAVDLKREEQQALTDALHAKDLGDPSGMADAVLAGIYFSLGKTQDAGTAADNALKANPNLAYAYFVQGQLAAANGDRDGAIHLYEQAWGRATADSTQPGSYIAVTLAKMYTSKNEFGQAEKILTDAEGHDKANPKLRYTLANLLYGQGDYNKSTEAAQQCLDAAQDYAPCYVLLTRLYTINKNWEQVSQMAQAAIKLGTTETVAYYNGGQADYQLNRCADAIPIYQAGLAISQKENDNSKISDFMAALNECGVTGGSATTPTSAPTPGPTKVLPHPTAKK